MKYIKLIILALSLSAFASGGDHHDHHDHHDHDDNHTTEKEHGHHDHHGHGGERTGEGKAITAVDEHDGFKLSKEATIRLKIRTTPYTGDLSEIEKRSYVIVGKEKALYRKRNGFYKLIDEHDFNKSFKVGDEIVTDGIELLRISDIFSTDKSEYGHAH